MIKNNHLTIKDGADPIKGKALRTKLKFPRGLELVSSQLACSVAFQLA